ncbi:MAG: PmoA family protein [Candidatus Hydrogenedentes bacterium]|nr:PmoA family protein [Candidatus Hydrogenedentota bacterium]
MPCQAAKTETGVRLTWIVPGLKAGSSQTLLAKPQAGAEPKDMVVLQDHSKDGRVDVLIGGDLFTSYHYAHKWVRPFLYPVIGPYGARVTRSWPMTTKVKGEHRDHIHHKSIWVAYGECNETDNWSEEKGHGWQRHQGFDRVISGPVYGEIVARNHWCTHEEKKQFEETRVLRFYAMPDGERLMDLDVTFRMTQGKIVFHDTKEGGLVSVRVASSMDVRNGGRIENGYGGVNEGETWGKKAPWCDYSGMVDGKHVGLAVLEHDKNPRYPTEWHVRDYGLMTANCFAWKYYRPEDGQDGDMTFPRGAIRSWRYRLFIHKGDARIGGVRNRFLDYIAPPTVIVAP